MPDNKQNQEDTPLESQDLQDNGIMTIEMKSFAISTLDDIAEGFFHYPNL